MSDLKLGDLPHATVAQMIKTGLSSCCAAPLVEGPHGGLSVNYWCPECRARFNLVMVPGVNWGQVVVLPPDPDYQRTRKKARGP
jgi:hypothetical protein